MKLPSKKPNYILRSILILAALLVVGGGGYLLYSASQESPIEPPAQQSKVVQPEPEPDTTESFKDTSEVPVRIVIDKIDVDAPIEPVGLTADGLMAAPDTNELVGWYDQSALVGGAKYAMLLDGHYGSDTVPAVFRQLTELEIGDSIEVVGDGGTTAVYRVADSYQRYAEDVDMKKALYPYKEGEQSLTIITCEGLYDPVNVTYDKRTVVYAVREA